MPAGKSKTYTVLRGDEPRSVHDSRQRVAHALHREVAADVGYVPDYTLIADALDRAERTPGSRQRIARDIAVTVHPLEG